jgi:hypothetical protein
MLKRLWSASTLTCAILLLASTSVLAKGSDGNRTLHTSLAGVGAAVDPVVDGAGPTTSGDDDAPFIDLQPKNSKAVGETTRRAQTPSLPMRVGTRLQDAHEAMVLVKLRLMHFWAALR